MANSAVDGGLLLIRFIRLVFLTYRRKSEIIHGFSSNQKTKRTRACGFTIPS